MRSGPHRDLARRAAAQGRRAAIALAAAWLLAGCGDAGPAPLRVSVIGIDGATWQVIDPLLERGELPHLARLLASGTRAPLRSERPLISPAIWTTLATGVSRHEHGIRVFAVKGGDLVSARQRRAPALWTLASRAGLRSAVIGWWGTYPAEQIDGVVISERALKAREEDLHIRFGKRLSSPRLTQLTHPPEVLELLAQTLFQMPDRAAEDSDKDWLARRTRVEDQAALRTLVKLRKRMGPFDLELLLLRGVDPVSHTFWRYYEPDASVYAGLPPVPADEQARYADVLEDQYRLVDALLGELPAEGTRERAVLLLSDHGFEAHVARSRAGETLTGHHRTPGALNGIFVAAGGPFRAGVRRETPVSIYDIAPSVLYLLGLPVAETLKGEVLTDLLDPDWVSAHPVHRVPLYAGPPVDLPAPAPDELVDEAAEARLHEELRALGYVE